MQGIIQFITRNSVLFISGIILFLVSFINPLNIYAIDWRVICLLFNLMLVIVGFQQAKLLDYLAKKLLNICHTEREVVFTLSLLCFFMAMFLTNDVALIAFVPLTMAVCKQVKINAVRLVVLETIGANLGSSLIPLGNPQNLFLYAYYKLSLLQFIAYTLPITLLGLVFIFLLAYKAKNNSLVLNLNQMDKINLSKAVILLGLFVLVVSSVFELVNYKYVTMILISYFLISQPKLLFKVDYQLLGIFIVFFLLVDSITHEKHLINVITSLLYSKHSVFISSLTLSQVISNVPASILLAKFCNFPRELILGVNVGGLGTLIASMASLISYRLFVINYPNEKKNYLYYFTKVNVCLLCIFIIAILLII
ncbi:MAG: SLC13 family permease [Burkholderiales bacterium]|nr:SLC13 family permease [Burkholderiales bacterium]